MARTDPRQNLETAEIVLRNRNAQLETVGRRCNIYERALQDIVGTVSIREAREMARQALGVVRGERES